MSSLHSIASDRGARNCPWVATDRVHRALLNNHLVDVLDLHGSAHGLLRDDLRPRYDPAGSYALRMRALSAEFRRQVTGAFARRVGLPRVVCVPAQATHDSAPPALHAASVDAMRRRECLIVGAVLADHQHRLFARIPMLLRLDIAMEMLDWPTTPQHLPDAVHSLDTLYVAVGAKRRPVKTRADGVLARKSLERVQAEMWLWNHLLSEVQGCDLGVSLLVGLHPQRKKSVQLGAFPAVALDDTAAMTDKSKNAKVFNTETWKLASVLFEGSQCKRGIAALEALAWRVKVVDEGEAWIKSALEEMELLGRHTANNENASGIFALASVTKDPNLQPNMKCQSMYDWPWTSAKRSLAEQLHELTLVYGVSRSVTNIAMSRGIPNDYAHPRTTAVALDINSELPHTLLRMAKPAYDGPIVTPDLIPHNRFNWRRLQGYSHRKPDEFNKDRLPLPFGEDRTFYVDFELASPEYMFASPSSQCEEHSADDKSSHCRYFDVAPTLPLNEDPSASSLIFMIGCGQLIKGQWKHRVFIAKSLSRQGESAVVREWLEHINSSLPQHFAPPILNVWGPEMQLLKEARKRMTLEDAHAVREIHPKVVNVLQIVKLGGVAIKGNLSYSLKMVHSSLERLGLLKDFDERTDSEVVSNGADAMAVGLDAAEMAVRENLSSLAKAPKIMEIAKYNEADCRGVARIVEYLRKYH